MGKTSHPLWRLVASRHRRPMDTKLRSHVSTALASAAVQIPRGLLERMGLCIDPIPALWKYLPGPYLRLFFDVVGGDPAVQEGQVVGLVLLHDPQRERTLYAHPIHAGPNANPLLKHLHGPMSVPKAQEGANGDRATLRLLEHKRAIWDRFLVDRETMEPADAGRLWRDRYFWALVRLYFCERCPACRWGSPCFDGAPGDPYRAECDEPLQGYIVPGLSAGFFEALRKSAAWVVESAYVQRSGLVVDDVPLLALGLGSDTVFMAFRTNVEFVEAGIPVGLALYADVTSGEVLHAHVLTSGPEPEPALLFSSSALGLPPPQPGRAGISARESYVRWRAQGWSEFWLRELEEGSHAASRFWLAEYWAALKNLFGVGDGDSDHGG